MGLPKAKEVFDEAPWWGEYLAQYHEACRYVRGTRVLDIGCGFGYGSRFLFDSGAIEVTGIDINAEQVAFAREKFGRDGVDFKVESAEHMGFASKSFDIVTCFQVLEKSKNPDEIIRNIHRVLERNGLALITTVNRQRFSKLHDAPAEDAHFVEFDQDELKDAMKRYFPQNKIAGLICTREADSKILKNPFTEKIPHILRNTVSRKVFGQTYFPTEKEFVLKNSDLTKAPLFYVTCKKS